MPQVRNANKDNTHHHRNNNTRHQESASRQRIANRAPRTRYPYAAVLISVKPDGTNSRLGFEGLGWPGISRSISSGVLATLVHLQAAAKTPAESNRASAVHHLRSIENPPPCNPTEPSEESLCCSEPDVHRHAGCVTLPHHSEDSRRADRSAETAYEPSPSVHVLLLLAGGGSTWGLGVRIARVTLSLGHSVWALISTHRPAVRRRH